MSKLVGVQGNQIVSLKGTDGNPIASATIPLAQLGRTALVSGSAQGTFLGANPAAFTGNFVDLQVAGVTKFKVSATGALTTAAAFTVSSGGLTVTAGGLTVTDGGGTITAGGLIVAGVPAAVGTTSLVRFGATAIANGSSAGTYLGINPASFGGNFVDFQVAGASKFLVRGDGVVVLSGVIVAPDGSAAVPSYTFSSDSSIGLYRVGAFGVGVAGNLTTTGYVRSANRLVETQADTYNLVLADVGKVVQVAATPATINLPVIAVGSLYIIENKGTADGNLLTIHPTAGDTISGGGITPGISKNLINTAATSKRGDRVALFAASTNNWYIHELVGTWAREA